MTLPPCVHDCGLFYELGPPPDLIARLPPPPVPAFLQNSADVLISVNGSCDLCNWARGLELPYIEAARQNSDDTIYFVAISTCIAIIILSILLVITVIRCKESKIKPVSDPAFDKRGCLDVTTPNSVDSYVNGQSEGFSFRRQPKMLWSGLGNEETNPYTLQHQPFSRQEPETFAHYDYIDYGSVGHTYAYPGEVVRIVNDKDTRYYYPDSLDVSFENSGFIDSENRATSL